MGGFLIAYILGGGVGGVTTEVVPGIEITLDERRLHADVGRQRLQYTLPNERLHATVSEN